MDDVSALRPAQCILLSVSLASDSNVAVLGHLYASRRDVFDVELSLRTLLTFLPESLDPSAYVTILEQITSGTTDGQYPPVDIDFTSVKDLSDAQARKRLRKIRLLPLAPVTTPPHDTTDLLTLFLLHRAYRIDAETALTTILPKLLCPFLDKSPYLKTWYRSTILPLLRFDHEYHTSDSVAMSLDEFENLTEEGGVSKLLSKTAQTSQTHVNSVSAESVGRDLRGLVGPWVYGANQRKRRRLKHAAALGSIVDALSSNEQEAVGQWQPTFNWIIAESAKDYSLAVKVIEGWDGPPDIDVDSAEPRTIGAQDAQSMERALEAYCQTGIAAIYEVDIGSIDAVEGSHAILNRLTRLLDFEPPAGLVTDMSALSLPNAPLTGPYASPAIQLQSDTLRQPDNTFTAPTPENLTLLQGLIQSSFLLARMGQPLSTLKVARLFYLSEEVEQLSILQKILHTLIENPKLEDAGWVSARDQILWLHNWTANHLDTGDFGCGVLGKLSRQAVEKEIFKGLCKASKLSIVVRLYLESASPSCISKEELEQLVIELFYYYYDNASNGNRTRGSMKKAWDILKILGASFKDSDRVKRCSALLEATHFLSFYSLTLQHGVPLRPASIRTYHDPVSLISKVLNQNPGSYAKLDDLIAISRNLVLAETLEEDSSNHWSDLSRSDNATEVTHANYRVIGMAIEAALAEEDFETAYSYVVNRLNLSSHAASKVEDDVSWRAAFQAGRHRSMAQSQSKPGSGNTAVRRIEQRMELLSHALQLAPSTALPEILGAWRRCEEELLTLLAQESEAEQDFDDSADKKTAQHVPGGFIVSDQTFMIQPRRKEVGRGAAEEAPMGLFDVARGAAAAFSKSAGALRTSKSHMASSSPHVGAADNLSLPQSPGSPPIDGERVRKRDMVANAMTSGLASGLGWVLGASPVNSEQNA